MVAAKLSKAQLKAFFHSKEQRVVDDGGKARAIKHYIATLGS
jgi:hypothetical protein